MEFLSGPSSKPLINRYPEQEPVHRAWGPSEVRASRSCYKASPLRGSCAVDRSSRVDCATRRRPWLGVAFVPARPLE